jgi:hypothetical protein
MEGICKNTGIARQHHTQNYSHSLSRERDTNMSDKPYVVKAVGILDRDRTGRPALAGCFDVDGLSPSIRGICILKIARKSLYKILRASNESMGVCCG